MNPLYIYMQWKNIAMIAHRPPHLIEVRHLLDDVVSASLTYYYM